MTKKILFIIGSLRKNSFNRQLAAKCREILLQKGAEVSELEYSTIPFMNQDSETPVPASINRVRTEVAAADGIWIFTPEYNFAVPGVLKNLLKHICSVPSVGTRSLRRPQKDFHNSGIR